MATHIVLGENQHASVDPALIPREQIRQTAKRLKLNAVMTQPAEEEEISAAAKSPDTLMTYVTSHQRLDWRSLWKGLGVAEPDALGPPCAIDFPCETETVDVLAPAQRIVIFKAALPKRNDLYVRYLKDGADWKFAGVQAIFFNEGVHEHRVTQIGSSSFLRITSDHSQIGAAIGQKLEEWYDLTAADFKPVFSFTAEGSAEPFCVAVGREFKSTFTTSVAEGVEKIEVKLELRVYGGEMGPPQGYTGVYERRQGEPKFTLRSATIPTEDFEQLADPFDVPGEKLLHYGFAWLQKLASGTDSDARECLGLMLERSPDTPEKRTLLDLLSKH